MSEHVQTYPIEQYGKPPMDVHRTWTSLSAGKCRPDGVPEACHSGGVWSDGEEAWKPLFVRPWANAEVLVRSQEDAVLAANAGTFLFPANWRVEEICGFPWLVRPVLHTDPDLLGTMLTQERLFQIEDRIRRLNRDGWEINDPISLAIGGKPRAWTLLDLSNAVYRPNGKGAFAADDEMAVRALWDASPYSRYADLRKAAHTKEAGIGERMEWLHERGEDVHLAFEVTHVYASLYRPLSLMWLPELKQRYMLMEGEAAHSWLCTVGPLPAEYIAKFELTLAWADWPHPLFAEEAFDGTE